MNLDSFKKGNCKEWFMPLWSLEELLEYRQHFYPDVSESVVNRLFEHWNGLIRYVIIKSAEYKSDKLNDDEIIAQVDKQFESAILSSNIKTLEEHICGESSVSKDEEISNNILLLDINTSTFQRSEDTLMTYHARKQVLIVLTIKCQAELFKFVDRISWKSPVSTKLNCVFEEVVSLLLPLGGKVFEARKLVDKDQQVSPIIKIISFSKPENTTLDCVCYFNEINSYDDDSVEKCPCTFQIAVGACQSNNVTWDLYNLFHSLYSSSSNRRKIRHFIVVMPRSNLDKLVFKKNFVTDDPKLIEELFEKTRKSDTERQISSDDQKLIANKALSEELEQLVDQYCLKYE